MSERKTYDIILADPPWRYSFSKTKNRKIENHYQTMTIPQIVGMPVDQIAKPDSFLLLWVPFPKLEEAFKVINGWGFKYITGDPWDKKIIGMGYYWRSRHELLLLGKRGKPRVPDPSDRPHGGMYEKRTRHSKKPEIQYPRIERMWGPESKVELFAREARPGWDVWGLEAPEAVALPPLDDYVRNL